MGSLAGEVKRREAAARAEADRLRARIGELSGDLARAEERVLRLAITREEVARVLEEPPEADAARQEGTPAGKPGPASPIGAVTVPPWQEGPRRRCCRGPIRICWKWPGMRGGPPRRCLRRALH